MMIPAARRAWWTLLFLLISPLITPCGAASRFREAQPFPVRDDLNHQGLITAIEQSLIYLGQRPENTAFNLLGEKVAKDHLARSLLFFRNLIRSNPSPDLLALEIKTYFDLYRASSPQGTGPANVLVTGYYQPVFAGSLEKIAPFLYPVYGIPDNIVRRRNRDGTFQTGRLKDGRFLPYWTRREIEKQGRARGFELVYLKDPFEAFLLHVQGSGLIRLRDGSLRSIHFAMKNARPYRSIGKYMLQSGKMAKKNQGIASIRDYLQRHPDEMEEIFHHNQSFIFFRWTEDNNAIGNLGRPLTPHRSIAVDQAQYPAAGLALLISKKPLLNNGNNVRFVPFNRFVLAQDTGSAIRGPGRVDLFWGTGEIAGRLAGRMKEKGEITFLLLKKNFL